MAKNNTELLITREESQRISILKLLMAFMVVFIHSYKTDINFAGEVVAFDAPVWFEIVRFTISEVLSRSAVPVFFFLSAYFLYRKPFSWKKNIAKKAKSILVPYFILNTFWIVVYFICQHIPAVSSFFSNPDTIVADWGITGWLSAFFGSAKINPMLAPLWFLRDLFIFNLLACVFGWIADKLGHFSLAIYVLLWLFLESTGIFFMNIQGLCFWGIGCYFAKQRISLSSLDKYKKWIIIAYVCLVIATVALRNTPGILFLSVSRLCKLVGLAFWYVCATKFEDGKTKGRLLSLSKYGFCIYLFHEMALSFTRKTFTRILPHTLPYSVALYFGIPIIIIIYCLVLSYLLDRYVPKFYGIISGGRS